MKIEIGKSYLCKFQSHYYKVDVINAETDGPEGFLVVAYNLKKRIRYKNWIFYRNEFLCEWSPAHEVIYGE